MNNFNPSDVGIANGKFFGFPYSVEEADIVIFPVPWDVTVSYNNGASRGPQAILEASPQLDFYDFSIVNAWKTKIGSININKDILFKNDLLRIYAQDIIQHLEHGGSFSDEGIETKLEEVNKASAELNTYVFNKSHELITSGKIVGVLGGDHSSPLGLINALCEKYDSFGILHIDAHSDLRKAYEGFTYSHASIMYNALQNKNITALVQVGIRDVSSDEIKYANDDDRITLFSDNQIAENHFNGILWIKQCIEIVSHLPENVYISFDIDGLSPENCPNTGTPVPGGLSFQATEYLIKLLLKENKKIIGFDLCEVAPSSTSEWDANVGARILYKLSIIASASINKIT